MLLWFFSCFVHLFLCKVRVWKFTGYWSWISPGVFGPSPIEVSFSPLAHGGLLGAEINENTGPTPSAPQASRSAIPGRGKGIGRPRQITKNLGWWFQPLGRIWKSMGRVFPCIWKIKFMFETTNQNLLRSQTEGGLYISARTLRGQGATKRLAAQIASHNLRIWVGSFRKACARKCWLQVFYFFTVALTTQASRAFSSRSPGPTSGCRLVHKYKGIGCCLFLDFESRRHLKMNCEHELNLRNAGGSNQRQVKCCKQRSKLWQKWA